MQRGIIYTPSALAQNDPTKSNYISDADLFKILKTQAERYNKQLYRAKKAGLSEKLYLVGGGQRVPMPKKGMSRYEMEKQYQRVQQRFTVSTNIGPVSATKKGLQAAEASLYKELADVIGVDTKVMENMLKEAAYRTKTRVIKKYKKADAMAKSLGSGNVWYEALKVEVESGNIANFGKDAWKGTAFDYNENGATKGRLGKFEAFVDNAIDIMENKINGGK